MVRPTGSLIAVFLYFFASCSHAVLVERRSFLIASLHVFGDVLKTLEDFYSRFESFWTTTFAWTRTVSYSLGDWKRRNVFICADLANSWGRGANVNLAEPGNKHVQTCFPDTLNA